MVDVHNTLVNTAFRTYGSSALKKKYLPRLATNTVGSFCLSEPASGSDAFALLTKATKSQSGGSYTISGQKMWITNAAESEIFVVFANIAPERGYKGITAFVVEKGMPGFNIAKKEKKLGIKASSTCVLTFDDVEVPSENLLGKEGEGYK
jgi:short-chain 2-methylacyl-CoA dehydrogenase